jgi:hypothetical protein
MTKQTSGRIVRIDSYSGKFNLFNPDQVYVVVRVWLPDGAPGEMLSAEWKDGKEPNIDNLPPSEVVSLIATKHSRDQRADDKALGIVAWCRVNHAILDKLWAQDQVTRAHKRIADAQALIAELTDNYIDIEE